ncbi:hypothetical protein GY45DRAFT_1320283 [Cubamyces sp. BRFM 1775]|nr:hypothetical protein GY45DRAFT_1320283 [Cubamyces sp. BRFM 1775]
MAHKFATLPYDDFMAEFLPPIEGEPKNDAYENMFDIRPTGKKGSDMYRPFADVVNNAGILSDFNLAVTCDLPNCKGPKTKKIDVAMYRRSSVPATGERTDWATIELTIEFKIHSSQDDPFDDKTEAGDFLGYAGLVFKYQHVTHHFSVIILGDCARVQRIDHAGLVFSSKFNYKQEPAKLGQFFWRLAHASPETRGHDPTAVHVSPSSPEGLEMLAWKNKTLPADDYTRQLFVQTLDQGWPWWKLQVRDGDGYKEFLVAKPTFTSPGVVGRATRGYVAYDKSNPDRPFAYLKDCWRAVHGRSELEGDILANLNQHGVSNVPTMLCHGDVGVQRTVSQDVWARLHRTQECRMNAHQHYRLVVNEVGLPLRKFPNGKELVSVLIDCLEAHEDAYTKAKIIHRDISVGNILLVPCGVHPKDQRPIYKGLLTDWELSKRTEYNELEARHPDRTGTWQFLSVNALKHPEAQIEIADELESFFHVLLYCAIRFLPHSCNDVSQFMYTFFDCGVPVGVREYTCSLLKSSVMLQGRLDADSGVPIVFLARPRTPEEIAAAIAQSKKMPSLPLSESAQDASTVNAKTTFTEDQRHPIDGIFETLLEWFEARYQLLKLAELARPSTPNRTPLSDVDADDPRSLARWQRNIGRLPPPFASRSAPDVAKLRETARNLSTHTAMLALLTERVYGGQWKIMWMGDDKLPDQLDPNFDPHPEKRLGKRTARDDDAVDESQLDSKRICSAASRV